jgi:hypothetical protein
VPAELRLFARGGALIATDESGRFVGMTHAEPVFRTLFAAR